MSGCLLYYCNQTYSDLSSVPLTYPTQNFNISQQLVTQFPALRPERGQQICLLSVVTFKWPQTPNTVCHVGKKQSAFRPFILNDFLMNTSNATIQRGYIPVYMCILLIQIQNLACIRQMTSPQGSLIGMACCLWCEIPIENQYLFCSGQFCPYYPISIDV